jgi:hypothetical protein
MSSTTRPAVAFENDTYWYPGIQADVVDTTLRVNAATP